MQLKVPTTEALELLEIAIKSWKIFSSFVYVENFKIEENKKTQNFFGFSIFQKEKLVVYIQRRH